MKIPVMLCSSYGDLPLPRFQTDGAVAVDLYAVRNGVLHAYIPTIVQFGLTIAIPWGLEGQIRGRSGLATKGVYCHVGTIDQDYRGELAALLTFTPHPDIPNAAFQFERGDRLAQLVISPVVKFTFREVDILPPSGRGAGGFGSTGIREEVR